MRNQRLLDTIHHSFPRMGHIAWAIAGGIVLHCNLVSDSKEPFSSQTDSHSYLTVRASRAALCS